MSDPGEASAGASGGAPASSNSPKPHGDKFAAAGRAAVGGGEADGSAGARPSGDSPKPHGDKLGSAARGRVAAPAGRGGGPDRGDG
jgi:hypothetical protein